MAKSADAFRTISEVSDWLETPAHVLRFWESRFTQVKPVKRAGGRRYYRPNDMLLLGGIKKLLHEDGLTIKEAQQVLRDQGVKQVADLSRPIEEDDATGAPVHAPASAQDVKASVDRLTARQQAPERPAILSDVPVAANSPDPLQQDLFTAPPEAPAEAPAPEVAEAAPAPAMPEESPLPVEPAQTAESETESAVADRLRALAATLDSGALAGALASNPAGTDALRPLYQRLRALQARMDEPLAQNNEN